MTCVVWKAIESPPPYDDDTDDARLTILDRFPDCYARVERSGALTILKERRDGVLSPGDTVAIFAPGSWLRCWFEEDAFVVPAGAIDASALTPRPGKFIKPDEKPEP